jgi:hypothetical protein
MGVGLMRDYTLKRRDLNTSHTLGYTGRKNSTPSIGSHGHTGGTRPGQTLKTPKDLSTHESEVSERGCGESVGLYVVYMREGGGLTGSTHTQKRHL